jgi:hypothetical protein
MNRRLLRFASALAALLAAAVPLGVTGPIHEIEALLGHEHCEHEEEGSSWVHVCHDEDACAVCAFLSLSRIHAPVESVPAAALEAAWPTAAVPADFTPAAEPPLFPARAPPATY